MIQISKSARLAAASISAFIAACGGGGGSDSSSTPTTPSGTTTPVVMSGPITGFGSVIVNGVRFDVSSAAFKIDDSSGGQDDLSVGQIVTIAGTLDDRGNRSASEVVYGSEIKGPVQSIDLANRRFVALGVTVVVSDATIFRNLTGLDALAVGNFVEVSGYPNASNGTLEASYVEKEDNTSQARLRGSVAALDTAQKRFTIGTTTVDYANATLDPSSLTLADGLSVEVRGSVGADAVLRASRIKSRKGFDVSDDRRNGKAEVEGLVSSVDGSRFVVNGVTVTISNSTVYERGTAADIVVGARLEAEGAVQADGSVVASKIEFKVNGGNGGGRDGRIYGTIEAVDATAGTIKLLNTTVKTNTSTIYEDDRDKIKTFQFAGLSVGDYVEIGFVIAGSDVLATRVERDDAETRSEVRGPVSSFDAVTEQLVIIGVAVDASSARYQRGEAVITQDEFYAALTAGAEVKAKGSYSPTTLKATEVELEINDDGDDGDDDNGDDGDDDSGDDSDDDKGGDGKGG
ncbi:hypothetical protein SAMN04488068_1495 [Hydrocarboniphaga daqingensis]|uniref:DUF5666 domain-containing protein n=1 Tax=Hydrocarboniphaga daqingensis TaxID=490188 RepID=A0A1M5MVR6_9GAMM|nr:DUF5666 domain-containing protein [Hydrocarboniphaga daqingensis]SHG81420.1 hypothetical protein SAMN04488068_1495 [Hydrocarboniphaga daqingensis]